MPGVRGSLIWPCLVTLVVVAVTLTSGCSLLESKGGDEVTTSTTISRAEADSRLCAMLDFTVQHMDDRSFADVVEHDPMDRDAIGAMVLLALLDDGDAAGRFDPALQFLARRSEGTLDPQGKKSEGPPAPSAAVVRNARELDRFLADGGCG